MTDPPPDAYGRVTNPERYRVVHTAARQLIDELRRTFVVEEDRSPELDRILLSSGASIGEVIRLVPHDDDAAPITFAFTDFPGVLVRAGRWQLWAYPRCGCDACDENPTETEELLRADVEAVTAGRMSEEWDGQRLHQSMVGADGTHASGWGSVERNRGSYGDARRCEWQAWRGRVGA